MKILLMSKAKSDRMIENSKFYGRYNFTIADVVKYYTSFKEKRVFLRLNTFFINPDMANEVDP